MTLNAIPTALVAPHLHAAALVVSTLGGIGNTTGLPPGREGVERRQAPKKRPRARTSCSRQNAEHWRYSISPRCGIRLPTT